MTDPTESKWVAIAAIATATVEFVRVAVDRRTQGPDVRERIAVLEVELDALRRKVQEIGKDD